MSVNDSVLPRESFVRFNVSPLPFPQLVWFDDRKISVSEVLNNAFFVPLHFLLACKDSKLVSACSDRYGGVGVGYHGGSARCAIRNGVQVKGVGKTPLLGIPRTGDIDLAHADGQLKLLDACREVIWSEVCAAALPFGAVESLAIVVAQTALATSNEPPDLHSGAALLMRRFELRPAHFLRNIFFRPHNEPTAPSNLDSLRVAKAMEMLASSFVSEGVIPAGSSNEEDCISRSLLILAKRFAFQLAAATAKRIFHGSLCCSNICLDGKFIDFGTMTSVPGYERLNGSTPFWKQEPALISVLLNLRLQSMYYLGVAPVDFVDAKQIEDVFIDTYRRRLDVEFLKLAGIPEAAVLEFDLSEAKLLFYCMKRLALRGSEDPFVIRKSYLKGARKPKLGRFDLNEVFLKIRPHITSEKVMFETLKRELNDLTLAAELSARLFTLFDWYFARIETGKIDQAIAMVQANITRLNAPINFLTKDALDERFLPLIKTSSYSRIGVELNSVIAAAICLTRDCSEDELFPKADQVEIQL